MNPATESEAATTPAGASGVAEHSPMNANPSDNWRALAACRGSDVDMFVPDARGTGQLLYVEARQVCAGCPVRQPCLDYAMSHFEEYGMWGGTTPDERRKMGYHNALIPCKICGVRFSPKTSTARYCSEDCRSQRPRNRTA